MAGLEKLSGHQAARGGGREAEKVRELAPLNLFEARQMSKVVGTDNHARDHVSDHVHTEGVTAEQAKLICEELNRGLGDGPGYYYEVKPDDYKPYVFAGW